MPEQTKPNEPLIDRIAKTIVFGIEGGFENIGNFANERIAELKAAKDKIRLEQEVAKEGANPELKMPMVMLKGASKSAIKGLKWTVLVFGATVIVVLAMMAFMALSIKPGASQTPSNNPIIQQKCLSGAYRENPEVEAIMCPKQGQTIVSPATSNQEGKKQ